MNNLINNNAVPKHLLKTTIVLCAVIMALAVFLALFHADNNTSSFSETVIELSRDWTITDSDGNTEAIDFPKTIGYGKDGSFVLSRKLGDCSGLIGTPALRFYSNYVDLRIYLDDTLLYSFPEKDAHFCGATGNTYHFVRMPADFAGKTLTVDIRGQLGDKITYLLTAPLLGAKATMLYTDVVNSLPSIMLASCMLVLAIAVFALYLSSKKALSLGRDTIYTALFSALFALYVYSETIFAHLFSNNGYLLCFITLILLALMPIPLMGIFAKRVSSKYRNVPVIAMSLCAVNVFVQLVLNFTGISSVRIMLNATHVIIIISTLAITLCMFASEKEKPEARKTLYSALPMVFGGITDIILINLDIPSMNNSFWFTLGVTFFIAMQFSAFLKNYFALYNSALEAKLLRDLAYTDALTGIGNRNAYELKLKELSGQCEGLGCIVLDINSLKVINDTLGHQAGDDAIINVGKILCGEMPEFAFCYRTGGDEFVILIEDKNKNQTQPLAKKIEQKACEAAEKTQIPLSLAIGFGHYEASDGNLIDFIRRVDSLMYECKRKYKSSINKAC